MLWKKNSNIAHEVFITAKILKFGKAA